MLAVVGGWVGIPEIFIHGGHKLEIFLAPVFAQSTAMAQKSALNHSTEWMLMIVSVSLSLIALIYAWRKFSRYQKTTTASIGISKVLENKWYVDELYAVVITRPLKSLAVFFNNVVEKKGIDGMVNGVGKAVNYGSRQIRWLQSGQVGAYVLLMVVGMLVLFIIQLFL